MGSMNERRIQCDNPACSSELRRDEAEAAGWLIVTPFKASGNAMEFDGSVYCSARCLEFCVALDV